VSRVARQRGVFECRRRAALLSPQHRPPPIAPDRKIQRPQPLPPQGSRRTLFGVRSASPVDVKQQAEAAPRARGRRITCHIWHRDDIGFATMTFCLRTDILLTSGIVEMQERLTRHAWLL